MAIDLASAVVSGPVTKPPKVVIYGPGGIGKTTFAAQAPNPIFLFTEEGQGQLDVARFEPDGEPVVRSWDVLLDCLSALYHQPHEFGTVVIDSLDFAEPLLWEHTARARGKEDIESFGFGKGYKFAVDEAAVMLQWLDVLRTQRNMAVVLIAHSEAIKFEDPELDTYRTFEIKLQDRLRERIKDWCDCILFANYRTSTTKDKGTDRVRAVGSGQRALYTQKRPAFTAKNRYGLPPRIDLSWDAFVEAISASGAGKSGADEASETEEPPSNKKTQARSSKS